MTFKLMDKVQVKVKFEGHVKFMYKSYQGQVQTYSMLHTLTVPFSDVCGQVQPR